MSLFCKIFIFILFITGLSKANEAYYELTISTEKGQFILRFFCPLHSPSYWQIFDHTGQYIMDVASVSPISESGVVTITDRSGESAEANVTSYSYPEQHIQSISIKQWQRQITN